MLLDDSVETTYRNCGITVLSPDREITDHMTNVCKNFGLSYEIIDPTDNKIKVIIIKRVS